MTKETLKTIIIAIILISAFSLWNSRLIEAKQAAGSTGVEAKEEILWLARVIYSETKSANEQVLIAWVVRNRVETGYRGDSYVSVAKSQGQFSGLNTFDNQYLHNIGRTYESGGKSWKGALEIAQAVYNAPGFMRPFSQEVRHFYSPKSLTGIHPEWSASHKPVLVLSDTDRKVRFAFYEGIK